MRNLILLFVIAVAITSAVVANADPRQTRVNAPLERAIYIAENSVVQLQGYLSSPCAEKPHPTLKRSANSETLILSVSAYQTQDMCIAILGERYELAFDIRSLKFELEKINVETNATYRIITENGDLDVVVDFSQETSGLPFSSEEITAGTIRKTQSGQMRIQSGDSSLPISSPFIDAEKYMGAEVSLSGHIVRMSLISDPFSSSIGNAEPLFIVTGIHTPSAP